MFHHIKDPQFNSRVFSPDPRFTNLLLEQFGSENSERVSAELRAFAAKTTPVAQVCDQ